MSDPDEKKRGTYLSTVQSYNLEVAVVPVVKAFWDFGFGVYQVGSSLKRQNWRDVDLRLIMGDEEFDGLFGKMYSPVHMLLNAVISEWLAARSGLPIDFQFQRQTEANEEFPRAEGHPRNALGVAMMVSWDKRDAHKGSVMEQSEHFAHVRKKVVTP